MPSSRLFPLVAVATAMLACAAPAALANPPVASFVVSKPAAPEPLVAGQEVTFNASASTADSAERGYRWFIDRPLESTDHLPLTPNPVLNRTFTAGTHTVDLVVSDEQCAREGGANCYSTKLRRTFEVEETGTGAVTPRDPRLQLGDARDTIQTGSGKANLQLGGGGSDTQRALAGNDVQLPDLDLSGLCKVRGEVFREMLFLLGPLGMKLGLGNAVTIRTTNAALKMIDASKLKNCDDRTPPTWPYRTSASAAAARTDDRLLGGAGNDLQVAGPGNDVLDGGTGRDFMFGGAGNDVIRARDRASDYVRCGPGKDSVVADKRDLVRKDCEKVSRR